VEFGSEWDESLTPLKERDTLIKFGAAAFCVFTSRVAGTTGLSPAVRNQDCDGLTGWLTEVLLYAPMQHNLF
jgi:hypothetical protein